MNVRSPWKPPYWLLALDFAGIALLGLGLHAHYAPGAAVLATAVAPLRLPLMVVGGLMLAAGTVLVMVLLLQRMRAG